MSIFVNKCILYSYICKYNHFQKLGNDLVKNIMLIQTKSIHIGKKFIIFWRVMLGKWSPALFPGLTNDHLLGIDCLVELIEFNEQGAGCLFNSHDDRKDRRRVVLSCVIFFIFST